MSRQANTQLKDSASTQLLRSECTALRGLAIMGIVLHNYCHWLGPVVKENEYQYIPANVAGLNHALADPTLLLPAHLISFFGHYGVPIFLFLSAYGLEKKYGSPTAMGGANHACGGIVPGGVADALRFVRYHFLKLFRMMIVGFICFTIIDRITPGAWHYTMTQVLAQLAMVGNLLSQPDRQIWPGPYWFFGLMLQLYIIYRLLMYRRPTMWTIVLVCACMGVQIMLPPDGDEINWYRYNFMGGMLPFGFGLMWARGEALTRRMGGETNAATALAASADANAANGATPTEASTATNNAPCERASWRLWLPMAALSALAIMGGAEEKHLWTIAPLAVCTMAVATVKLLPAASLRPLVWIGDVSAALFVIHPVLRKVFIPISRGGDVYTGLLLYVIASIGAAWLIRELMRKIPNPRMR